jgi:hypothetical protein
VESGEANVVVRTPVHDRRANDDSAGRRPLRGEHTKPAAHVDPRTEVP